MLRLANYLNRRLTAWQAAAVIVTVAVLAGILYAAYLFTTATILAARVNAALPRVRAEIRDQRTELIKAIEAYRAQFGAYPPDHVLRQEPRVVDPITNTLLYELVGVVYTPTNQMFRVDGLEPAAAQYVRDFFQCAGFKNCAESPEGIRRFLALDPLPTRQLHDDPDVFALGFNVPYEGLAPEVVWQFEVSPWRYVSSSPTNNPGRFDLWIEVKTPNRTVVVGNWPSAE